MQKRLSFFLNSEKKKAISAYICQCSPQEYPNLNYKGAQNGKLNLSSNYEDAF